MDSTPGRPARTFQTPYGTLDAAETAALLSEAQNHRCCYCGARMIEYKFHPPEHLRLSIEHVISRSRGGADCWDNLVAACRRCNSWRSAYTLKDGHEISAIAWFYKRQAGEDVRPLRQRRQKGPAIVPKGQVLAGFSAAGQPIIQPARKKSSPYSGTSRSRFKALSRRLRAQEVFCGHDVQFGSNRLPKVSTPAVPIEGATLGSLWPR